MRHPLTPPAVKGLVRAIRVGGTVAFSSHGEQQMAKRGISRIDVDNILRGGTPQEGEMENGSWRYRICTPRFVVVVAFRSETALVVVTAWRVE